MPGLGCRMRHHCRDTIAIGRTRRHAHQPGVSVALPLSLSPPSSPPPPLIIESFTTPTLAIRRGRNASLPIVVLLPSRMGAAPGLDDAVHPQRRKVQREEKHPGGGGWAGRPARPPPTTVRECHCILLPRQHLDEGLFVSSPIVMDNHIDKQKQQAVLEHNKRDSDVLGRGQRNTRAGERVLLRKRRELCQSNSGLISSGFFCFIVLPDL